jgi:sterol-4alpha-carboxylate 3-dehydrogenase (decarboxylating)
METATHLITGGCGLQGSHIVLSLLERYPKSTIAVMARNPTVNTFPGVSYHHGDITSPSDIDRVLSAVRPTVVYHCAGAMTVGRKPIGDSVVRKINVDGTRLMLEASARFGVRAFVFTSSASVAQKYGGGFADLQKCDETAPTVEEEDGGLSYPWTKAAAERLVLRADNPVGGMRTVALRPAVIYGERDNDMIPNLMATYRAGRHRMQIGDGRNLLSVTYIANSTAAHLLAAARLLEPDPTGVAGEAFFITNGEPVPFWEFARAVFRAAGDTTRPDQIRVVNRTVALCIAWVSEWVAWLTGTKPVLATAQVKYTTMHRWYNITKARERLGYEPEVDWEEGVRRGVKVSSSPWGFARIWGSISVIGLADTGPFVEVVPRE